MRTIVLCALLTACTLPVRDVYAPDGKAALYVQCGAMAQCYDAASRRCQGPYLPLNEGIAASSTHGYSQGGTGYVSGGTLLGLTFRCQ